MKSAVSTFISGYWIALSLCLLSLSSQTSAQNYAYSRVYVSSGPNSKGGWRPIVTSGSGATGSTSYNIGHPLNNGQAYSSQKLSTGPSTIESKSISADYYGSAITTSTRPIATRDINKLSTYPQNYKTAQYPQSNVNFNSPVNSYLNPYVQNSNPGVNTFKLAPGYQFENNNIFLRHPQSTVNHHPIYSKPSQGQMVFGKRPKHNQLPNQPSQHLGQNQYHQTFQSYQNSIKKPIETYVKPSENYIRPVENISKPNIVQKIVNPHESLIKQTSSKTQSITPVTYKPPIGSQFQQQFGQQEDPFGPIPSSILGSFSSFGHASVKARDPAQYHNKNAYLPQSSTKAPYVSTESFILSSTDNNSNLKDSTVSTTSNHIAEFESLKDDYAQNLVPPPNLQKLPENTLSNDNKVYSGSAIKNSFVPSPPDPLNKYHNSYDSTQFSSGKPKTAQSYVYNSNSPTKRPGVSSFFDTTSSPEVTTDLHEPQSTNIIPESLLVQLPPPYTSFNSYNGHSIKLENNNYKDKYQAFSAINHNNAPSNYKPFQEEIQYFPARSPFEIKYKTNYKTSLDNVPNQHGYEVTENWGISGEGITQPTLHSWVNPSPSFQQFGSPLKSPNLPFKVIAPSENTIISQPYFPTSLPIKEPETSLFDDVTTIYSTIAENNRNNYNPAENLVSLTEDVAAESERPEVVISSTLAPVITEQEEIRTTTTESSEDVTSTTTHFNYNSRRKPSRYRPQQETQTSYSNIEEEITTKFETYKENVQETENDLQVNDLPTIPPNKFFKRPVLTTSIAPEIQTEDNTRKRNKSRRRRPTKPQTENTVEEMRSTTEQPVRNYKYRTTTQQPEADVVTKFVRPKHKFTHKTRPTRPSTISESTSSAQPTMLPTIPVTLRPKLHSRVRITTPPSLDFEDLPETTTVRGTRVADSSEQSSIMKIAKDHHFHRSPSKYSLTGMGIFNESPDYSHKQDEKDTPTSDISINTYDNKYSSQLSPTEENNNEETEHLDSNTESTFNTEIISTSPIFDEKSTKNIIQTSQSTQIEQLFTEMKSGNRGNTKADTNISLKMEPLDNVQTTVKDEEVISTTPMSNTTKSLRNKNKSSKYDTNRPRFSVKDYRNRLNQYTSSSTEKPTVSSESSSTRLRFPNRSRFPSFKDPYADTRSELSTSTEAPRKKFTPKDPRHKDTEDNVNDESADNVVSTVTERINASENEVTIKPVPKLRSSLRRKTTTSTSAPDPEKQEQKVRNIHSSLNRPILPGLRKRIQFKNKTTETDVAESPVISSTTEMVLIMEEDNSTSTEKSTSETAIMKIAKEDRKHSATNNVGDGISIDPSQRVADLTLAASKEYNTPGLFKSLSSNTRKVPNYFTIATDDPILPIEAFFPQLNQKKDA